MIKERGITLIALIVTIIIMLILAGISMQFFYEGGILEKAKNAGNIYESSASEEANSLDRLSKLIDRNNSNYDNDAPNVDLTIQQKAVKGQTLVANVNIQDAGSGADLTNSKWVMNQSADSIGDNDSLYTNSNITDGKINVDTQNSGDFYLHILAKDKNENTVEKVSNKITIIEPIVNDYAYTGAIETFTASENGTYKIESWGAQGGGDLGGKGGYSYGEYSIDKGNNLYICIGNQGVSGTDTYVNYPGGYNGGGSGGQGHMFPGNLLGPAGSGGGGATSITTTNRGILSNFSSYREEVIMVAGGGGGYGWNTTAPGGNGGGNAGDAGESTKYSYPNHDYLGQISTGGTQTSGYAFGLGQNGRNGTWDTCGAEGNGGGGGGWYGGTASQAAGEWTNSGGGGGSGHIHGTLTSSGMENGNNQGNGKVKITLISINN